MTDLGAPPSADAIRYGFSLLLMAVAGAVDAVGFLTFRTFYVSFMSGNSTRLGILMGQGDGARAVRGGAVIAVFVAGVVVGDFLTGSPPRRAPATLTGEAALLLGAAALATTSRDAFGSTLLMAFAMGAHNALVRHAERISVPLTYVTGTLVHIGRGLAARLAGRSSPSPLWPYIGLWLALLAGAVLGSVMLKAGEPIALLILSVVLAGMAAFAGRRSYVFATEQ